MSVEWEFSRLERNYWHQNCHLMQSKLHAHRIQTSCWHNPETIKNDEYHTKKIIEERVKNSES